MDNVDTAVDTSMFENKVAIIRIVDLATTQISLGEEEDCLQAQHCIKLAMDKKKPRDAETRARLLEGAAARLIVCARHIRRDHATSD